MPCPVCVRHALRVAFGAITRAPHRLYVHMLKLSTRAGTSTGKPADGGRSACKLHARTGHPAQDRPNGSFGVTVPDLPGCFSAGDTLAESLENTQEAIALHIQGMLLDGDPFLPFLGRGS